MKFQFMAEAVRGRAYQAKFDVLANGESQVGECAEFAAGEGGCFVFTILGLDSPITAIHCFRYKVDPFIQVGEVEMLSDLRWYFFEPPDVTQLGLILRLKEQILLRQFFKAVALFLLRQGLHCFFEVLPAVTCGYDPCDVHL